MASSVVAIGRAMNGAEMFIPAPPAAAAGPAAPPARPGWRAASGVAPGGGSTFTREPSDNRAAPSTTTTSPGFSPSPITEAISVSLATVTGRRDTVRRSSDSAKT